MAAAGTSGCVVAFLASSCCYSYHHHLLYLIADIVPRCFVSLYYQYLVTRWAYTRLVLGAVVLVRLIGINYRIFC